MPAATDSQVVDLQLQVKMLQETSRQSNLVRKRYKDSLSVLKQKDLELKLSHQRIENDLKMLRQMQQELVEKEKMAALGSLVAGVAHEVNTPIGVAVTSISSCSAEITKLRKTYEADDLSESDMDLFFENAVESMQIAGKSLNHAARLIHSFKQISVDQNADDMRQFDVCSYLGHIIRTFRSPLKKARITVESKCPEILIVKTYPGSLVQIFNNLLLNTITHAYKQNETGTICIQIDRQADRLHILFADEGKGMDEELRMKAFQPFVTTARDKGGSGLGLNIVYNLVTQRFGGDISVESEPGKGCRFFITLNIQDPR